MFGLALILFFFYYFSLNLDDSQVKILEKILSLTENETIMNKSLFFMNRSGKIK